MLSRNGIIALLLLFSCNIFVIESVRCENDCGVCHVDCSDNVEEACKKSHEGIESETLWLTLEAYQQTKQINGTIRDFLRILNRTYQPFFYGKYQHCIDHATPVFASYNPYYLIIVLAISVYAIFSV